VVGRIEAICAALEREGVAYLIVGGVAVVLHGYLRTTADLDLVVKLTPENATRTVRALAQLGFRPRAPVAFDDFASAEIRQRWIEDKDLTVFSVWNPADPGAEIDLFVREPFDFDAVHRRAVRVALDSTTVTVIALDDLVVLKRQAGRARDLEDIEALTALGLDEDDKT
jgi:hypothetical protein